MTKASPFQAVKTWKTSTDPDYEAKKNRVLELYAIADGRKEPGPGDPCVVMCMDEFGPLNLQPHPGKQWSPVATGKGSPDAEPPQVLCRFYAGRELWCEVS